MASGSCRRDYLSRLHYRLQLSGSCASSCDATPTQSRTSPHSTGLTWSMTCLLTSHQWTHSQGTASSMRELSGYTQYRSNNGDAFCRYVHHGSGTSSRSTLLASWSRSTRRLYAHALSKSSSRRGTRSHRSRRSTRWRYLLRYSGGRPGGYGSRSWLSTPGRIGLRTKLKAWLGCSLAHRFAFHSE